MLRPAVQVPKPHSAPSGARRLPRPRRQRSLRKHSSHPRPNPGLRSRHAFILFLVLLSQWLFFSSSLFQVQEVKIEGLETLTKAQVLKQVELSQGDSVWKQSPTRVSRAVAQLQNVAQATVSFQLPGKLKITVLERQPAFQVASNSLHPTWYAVDEHGLVLRKLKGASNDWPRFKLEENLEVGQRLHPALMATMALAAREIESCFPASVWYYILDQRGNLSFRTFSKFYPLDVQLGQSQNLSRKLEILRALMVTTVAREEVKGVDLRFSTPVVQMRRVPKPVKPAENQE